MLDTDSPDVIQTLNETQEVPMLHAATIPPLSAALKEEVVSLESKNELAWGGAFHYAFLRTCFLRGVGLLWVLLACLRWYYLFSSSESSFETLSLASQYWMIFFLAFDIVAAVGLWLLTSWGTGLWLVVLACHVLAPLTTNDFFVLNRLILSGYIALAITYFVLDHYAKREHEGTSF